MTEEVSPVRVSLLPQHLWLYLFPTAEQPLQSQEEQLAEGAETAVYRRFALKNKRFFKKPPVAVQFEWHMGQMNSMGTLRVCL